MTTVTKRGRRLLGAWAAFCIGVLLILNGYQTAKVAQASSEVVHVEFTLTHAHSTSYPLLVAICNSLPGCHVPKVTHANITK